MKVGDYGSAYIILLCHPSIFWQHTGKARDGLQHRNYLRFSIAPWPMLADNQLIIYPRGVCRRRDDGWWAIFYTSGGQKCEAGNISGSGLSTIPFVPPRLPNMGNHQCMAQNYIVDLILSQ